MFVFLGPPGAGKGTQAQRLSKELGLRYFSPGDELRKAIANHSWLGLKVKPLVESGALVPDEPILELVRNYLQCQEKAVIFDGIPRTLTQALGLDEILNTRNQPLKRAIFFELPSSEVISRLTARRVCECCGAIYNPALTSIERCKRCGGALGLRRDDTIEVIQRRLEMYEASAESLYHYYAEKGIARSILGVGNPDEVYDRLLRVIDGDQLKV
jgi:adenylate kinase